MLLDVFIKELANWPWKMQTGARIGLYTKANRYMSDFEKRSPVDTSEYRSSWRMRKGTQKSISVNIYNKDEKAQFMEFGAMPEEAPWYFPKNKRRSTSGKLVKNAGRIWAGGLDPGISKTKGGAIDPVLFKNPPEQMRLTKVIANSIIERLK